MKQTIED